MQEKKGNASWEDASTGGGVAAASAAGGGPRRVKGKGAGHREELSTPTNCPPPQPTPPRAVREPAPPPMRQG